MNGHHRQPSHQSPSQKNSKKIPLPHPITKRDPIDFKMADTTSAADIPHPSVRSRFVAGVPCERGWSTIGETAPLGGRQGLRTRWHMVGGEKNNRCLILRREGLLLIMLHYPGANETACLVAGAWLRIVGPDSRAKRGSQFRKRGTTDPNLPDIVCTSGCAFFFCMFARSPLPRFSSINRPTPSQVTPFICCEKAGEALTWYEGV